MCKIDLPSIHKSSRRRYRMAGQALVEVTICAALVIALVPGIVVLFKYAQMRQFADELVRYTVWERTVWADPNHRWDNEAAGQDKIVQAESELIAARGISRLGNSRQSISSARETAVAVAGTAGERQPWGISPQERQILNLADNKAGSLTGTEQLSPGIVDENWDAVNNQLPAQVLTGNFEMPLLQTNHGLELNSNTLVTAVIDTPLNNLYGQWEGLFPLSQNALGTGMGVDFQLTAQGSILANAWTPKNEGVFCNKVHGLDLKSQLAPITAINSAVDDFTSFIPDIAKRMIPFLSAVTQAGNPELHASTSVLPYIRALPFHIDGGKESGTEGFGDKPGGVDLERESFEGCS